MMITAHSGCDGTAMNTMEYLTFASEQPIDFLEVDVRKSRDGRLLLTHDPIGDSPLLSLEEAFRFLADKKIGINCDLKEYGLEDDILSCAEAFGIGKDRIIFTGAVTACWSFQREHPDVCVFINPEELVSDFYGLVQDPEARKGAVEALMEGCRIAGYKTININYLVCDEALFQRCAEEGVSVSVWTVNEPEDIRRMKDHGVVNLTTNAVRVCAGL